MMEEVEFKTFMEIRKKTGWQFATNRPSGQQWGYEDNFFTNRRGEGFRVHGSTKMKDKYAIIDALNKRDAEITKLKNDALQKVTE